MKNPYITVPQITQYIKDSEIKSYARMVKNERPAAESYEGHNPDDTRLVEMKDGRVYTLVNERGWYGHWQMAERIAEVYRRACGLTEKDLGFARITSQRAPGLTMMGQSPKGTAHEAVICRTLDGRFVIWYDENEE